MRAKRKLVAAGAAIALAISLTACGPREQDDDDLCVDRDGTQYVCDDDDDDDDGWFPVFIPWSQPYQPSHNQRPVTPHKAPAPKPKAPAAPAPKAPAYKAPAPKAPAYRAPTRSK